MLVIEEIIDRHSRARPGWRREIVRTRNLYRGTGETNTTITAGDEDNRIQRIWSELNETSDSPRAAKSCAPGTASTRIQNAGSRYAGEVGTPFTTTHRTAGALVLLYQDGTAPLNHGGTEMGQGLHEIALIPPAKLG